MSDSSKDVKSCNRCLLGL